MTVRNGAPLLQAMPCLSRGNGDHVNIGVVLRIETPGHFLIQFRPRSSD
jgi:hypothetical protein